MVVGGGFKCGPPCVSDWCVCADQIVCSHARWLYRIIWEVCYCVLSPPRWAPLSLPFLSLFPALGPLSRVLVFSSASSKRGSLALVAPPRQSLDFHLEAQVLTASEGLVKLNAGHRLLFQLRELPLQYPDEIIKLERKYIFIILMTSRTRRDTSNEY